MKKIIPLLIIIIIIALAFVLFKINTKKTVEVLEGTGHESIDYPQNDISEGLNIPEDKIEQYVNVTESEGVAQHLVNDDNALDFMMRYAVLFYSNNSPDSDKNKIYISIESIIDSNTDEDNSLNEIPKAIVEMAYKELFEKSDINLVDTYDYKYDAKSSSFIKKDEFENVDKVSIVKITKIEDEANVKEIEYYYTYINDSEDIDQNDCYKTTIRVKTNNQYSFSKYKLIDLDAINIVYSGKVYENK